jgi:hypothetical protein
MAKYTKKEFADMTGQTTKTLSVYAMPKNGKVIYDASGMVDMDNLTNQAFLAKHGHKAGQVKEVKRRVPQQRFISPIQPTLSESYDDIELVAPNNEKPAVDGSVRSLSQSEQEYQHYRALNTQLAAELNALKILKLKGDVIPTEPIESLIFQFKQSVLTQNKITMQRFLSEIGHKYDITPEDMAHYRGYYVNLLNQSAEEANTNFIDSLGGVLAEFAVKK